MLQNTLRDRDRERERCNCVINSKEKERDGPATDRGPRHRRKFYPFCCVSFMQCTSGAGAGGGRGVVAGSAVVDNTVTITG
jgi:hypothetical protein